MPLALALSDRASPRAQVASASQSPLSNADKESTGMFRKSAEKLTHPKLNLAEARAKLRAHAKGVIFTAFPARSQHETCIRAAQVCGVSPDKIERLINGAPVNPDLAVLGHIAKIARHRTGKETPICNVIAQIMGVEAFA